MESAREMGWMYAFDWASLLFQPLMSKNLLLVIRLWLHCLEHAISKSIMFLSACFWHITQPAIKSRDNMPRACVQYTSLIYTIT